MSRQKYKPKEYWTLEVLKEEAKPFNRRIDFKRGNTRAYNIARKMGPEFMDLVCSHMESSLTEAYGDEELRIIALSFNSRGEFFEKDRNAYCAAHKRGKKFLDSICSHMRLINHSAYSDEELLTIALGYERRTDFKNGDSGAYSAVYDRGPEFMKAACHHMKKGGSKPEETILAEVRKYFPHAKKFLATKLIVPEANYITKLEVDVLVSELGLAIEYDGRYHHSLEGLKRGHPTWKLEHLKRYHEIKDAAFLALGIKIHHVKDKEWRKNPQNCIRGCLEFLGISQNEAE